MCFVFLEPLLFIIVAIVGVVVENEFLDRDAHEEDLDPDLTGIDGRPVKDPSDDSQQLETLLFQRNSVDAYVVCVEVMMILMILTDTLVTCCYRAGIVTVTVVVVVVVVRQCSCKSSGF